MVQHPAVMLKAVNDHHDPSCSKDPKCANCGSNHVSSSNYCPEWQTQSQILKLKHQNNTSFVEAKKQAASQIQCETSPSIPYSAVVSGKPKTVSIACQTDLTWMKCDKLVKAVPSTSDCQSTVTTSASQTMSQPPELSQTNVDVGKHTEKSKAQRKRPNCRRSYKR